MNFEPTLIFDIETVPDVEAGRRLHGLEGLDDAEVRQWMQSRRIQDKGHDFMPPYLQRVVAIAVTYRRGDDTLDVRSIGEPGDDEAQLLTRFFDGIEKTRPRLVSWNGSGFDLPVLHHRALIKGVAAPAYWETGRFDRERKFANYLSRYHEQHLDIMDMLALYNARNYAPLSDIAQLLGYPGKLGMDGSAVAGAWEAGDIDGIRAYCETDVMNTWLVYLRFMRMRGWLSAGQEAEEVERVRGWLAARGEAHWVEFNAALNGAGHG